MQRFIPIILFLAATGCRETEPPPTHFRNLGTDGSPLLPTAPVWKTAAIAKGQAEWRPFRDPSSEPELDQDGGPPDTANAAIEAEIGEVIAEFNEVLNDGTVDEILEYFVADQAEALEPIVETALATKDVIQKLRGELGTKLPDATERIENAVNAILADMSLELMGETYNVKSDTEVGLTVKGGVISQEYTFVIEDDEWYIRVVETVELADRASALERGLQYYRDMLESVRSGAVPPEDRLKELESAVAAAHASAPPDTETDSNAASAPAVSDDAGD